jgi:hypothetical protein
MGKDLTSMIEEINNASSSLNKSSKPDDPVSNFLIPLTTLPGFVRLMSFAFPPISFLKSSRFSTATSRSFNGSTRMLQHSNRRYRPLKELARVLGPMVMAGSGKRLQMTFTGRSGGGGRRNFVSAREHYGLSSPWAISLLQFVDSGFFPWESRIMSLG